MMRNFPAVAAPGSADLHHQHAIFPQEHAHGPIMDQQPIDFLPENYEASSRDIFCGRGHVFAKRPGNLRFAKIVRTNLRRYQDAAQRNGKTAIIGEILRDEIIAKEGMRFVKYHVASKRWYVLSREQAHHKVGHAIRDQLRLLKSGTKTAASSSSSRHNASSKSSKKIKELSTRSRLSWIGSMNNILGSMKKSKSTDSIECVLKNLLTEIKGSSSNSLSRSRCKLNKRISSANLNSMKKIGRNEGTRNARFPISPPSRSSLKKIGSNGGTTNARFPLSPQSCSSSPTKCVTSPNRKAYKGSRSSRHLVDEFPDNQLSFRPSFFF